METKYSKCKICGVELCGFGTDNLEKNRIAHIREQHKIKELISQLEVIIADVEIEEEYPTEGITLEELKDMRKDDLNDFAVKYDLGIEIKSSMRHATMVSKIWKALE